MEIVGIIIALGVTYVAGFTGYVTRAIRLAKKGQPDRALEILNKADRYFPLSMAAQVRGQVLLQYFRDYEAAINDFNRALRFGRRDAKSYSLRGYAYYRLGHTDDALRDLDIAIALKPRLMQSLIYRSEIRREMLQDYEGAIADCKQAIIHHPEEVTPYIHLSEVYMVQKNYEEALDVWGRALKLGVNEAHAHMMRAMILREQLGNEHAMKDLQLAGNLAPGDVFIAFMHGNFYSQGHEYQKALNIYTQVIQQGLSIPEIFVNRARVYSRLDQSELARVDYETALRLNPHIADIYNSRAYHLARLGQYESSLADANRCIEMEPIYKYGYGTRGQTHFLMGNLHEALADFEKAEEISDDAYYHIAQAVVHHKLGNTEAMQGCWNNAIKTDAKFTDVDVFELEYVPAKPFLDAVREVAALT